MNKYIVTQEQMEAIRELVAYSGVMAETVISDKTYPVCGAKLNTVVSKCENMLFEGPKEAAALHTKRALGTAFSWGLITVAVALASVLVDRLAVNAFPGCLIAVIGAVVAATGLYLERE